MNTGMPEMRSIWVVERLSAYEFGYGTIWGVRAQRLSNYFLYKFKPQGGGQHQASCDICGSLHPRFETRHVGFHDGAC
jgi:hypothetical protein